MKKLIKYNEKHFNVGTKVCNKETGSIGIVQPDFGDIDHFLNDVSELVPVKWGREKNTCAVFAAYLTDNFTLDFSDSLKSSCNSADWY